MTYSKPLCFKVDVACMGLNQGGTGGTIVTGQVPVCAGQEFPLDSYSFFITSLASDQEVTVSVEAPGFDVALWVETPDQNPAICSDGSNASGAAGREEVTFIASDVEGIGIFVFSKQATPGNASYTLRVSTQNEFTLEEDENFVDCQANTFGCANT